jgi:hypothetical protein
MKFTQQSLTALTLPAGKTEHIEWDDAMPGLGIRLRETKHGLTKSFRIQYRVGAQQRAKHLARTLARLPASSSPRLTSASIWQRRKPRQKLPRN